ncbi:MAG: outer membrane protein assembly factor BamD [Candidatus Marinimicrobia bacterium]|nr:outer membrane protein assembly factor BamD [Candidatus Neomarinimicrobiota bacterium]
MKFLTILFLILFIGCSNSKVESADKLWTSAIEFRESEDLRSSITNFKSIIQHFPESEFSSKAQFQIADIYLNDVKDYPFAIQEFETLIRKYPEATLAKKSAFMIAYVYSNYLDEYSSAMEKYELFLKKYPDDELVPSVEFELEGLRKYQPTIDSLNNL